MSDPQGLARPPLGRRAPDVDNLRRAVDATPFLRRVPRRLPAHPTTMTAAELAWPMLRNDQAGVCVLASSYHDRLAGAARFGVPCPPYSDMQLLADYRTQNPDFRGWSDGGSRRDQGMVMQTWFEELVAQRRLAAFGRLDPDPDIIRAATWVMGAVTVGATLTDAQADQFDSGEPWDTVPGSPEWGGHAVALDGYAATSVELVSWGRQTSATNRFVAGQVDEVWLLLWPEQVVSRPPGFDLAGFAEAVRDVTGGKVDPLDFAPPDPWPAPADPVEPDPVPGGCLASVPSELARAARNAYRRARNR